MRKSKIVFFLLAAASLSITISCAKSEPESLEDKTLASLTKLSSFPLYTMTYYGDYGFEDYLKTGSLPFPDAAYKRTGTAMACTCFAALGSASTAVFGRNFDFFNRASLLLFTDSSKGYASFSMIDLAFLGYSQSHLPDDPGSRENLLRAPYWSFDGMNEKGVAIGMMAVPSAQAPAGQGKVMIGEIQVLRLVLDYAADVEEAVSLIGNYNIQIQEPPIHYLISDRSGRSAVVELVGGQLVVLRNDEPWQVATNFTIYGTSVPRDVTCWRYNKAYQALCAASGVVTMDEALSILSQVSQGLTMWSLAYGMYSGEVRVAMGRDYDHVRIFNLKLLPGI